MFCGVKRLMNNNDYDHMEHGHMNHKDSSNGNNSSEDPLIILKKRFVNGEISEDEYKKMKEILA